MNKGFIYILLSIKDRKSYVGSTDNLSRRFASHVNGQVLSTKYRRPLRLIYSEEFETLTQARSREKYLKSRQGRRELKKLFFDLKLNDV